MADLKDVTFNVGISISNETVHRCCQLLGIYLQDNPDKTICVDDRQLEWSGERQVSVFIGEKSNRTPFEEGADMREPKGEKGTGCTSTHNVLKR